jgi:hypothetical protein
MKSMRILISISDPWELGEALKWQPLRGELLQTSNDEHGDRALIKLDDAIDYRGSQWRYVVTASRHEGTEIAGLRSGKKIIAAFTGISDQQAESGNPLDTSNWRGGLAFTGDVEPAI